MTDKLLAAISLCRKAGKLVCGFDVVAAAAQNGSAALVVFVSDLSERSRRKMTEICEETGTPVISVERTMAEVAVVAGKSYGILAVCDKGFADMIRHIPNTPDTQKI